MSRRRRPKRAKKYLLTTAALSVGSMLVGCGSKQSEGDPKPLPGNPKGSVYPNSAYDAGAPKKTTPDAGSPSELAAPPDAATPPEAIPLPGNPKGALYDDGAFKKSDES